MAAKPNPRDWSFARLPREAFAEPRETLSERSESNGLPECRCVGSRPVCLVCGLRHTHHAAQRVEITDQGVDILRRSRRLTGEATNILLLIFLALLGIVLSGVITYYAHKLPYPATSKAPAAQTTRSGR